MSVSMSFYPQPSARVTCYDYGPDRPPLLNFWSDPVHLTISGDSGTPIADRLVFARELAAAATAYLAAVERFTAAAAGRTP